MITINASNVHVALPIGMRTIQELGAPRPSRFGAVLVVDGPVTTLFQNPSQRVLFHPERDANPFFHFMESLWMMAGRNDVKWITQFNSTFAQFSDDGKTFHGAYGYRWRKHFDMDQLSVVAEILKKDSTDRRCVIQMWDSISDLGQAGKDFPCNLMIAFRVSNYGHLDMTVFNRSNDMIWGAYGANAVHMSFLQEVMAAWIGVPVGRYWQVSNNFHAYREVFDKHSSLLMTSPADNPYLDGEVQNFPVVNEPIDVWLQDLDIFLQEGPIVGFRDIFFRRVAVPIYVAWKMYKSDDPNRFEHAISTLENCVASDWKRACVEWLQRRAQK